MDTLRSTRPAFSRVDRRRLVQALAQAHEARLYRRLRAVAEVAEGEPVAAVARRARVARSSVHRWIARYLQARTPSALADDVRCGRARAAAALTDDRLRQLLTSDPRPFGYNANAWTVPLLTSDPRPFGYNANAWTVPLLAAYLRAEGLTISARTLRRRIRAARFRWKRPRYVYSERAEQVGAKKGELSAG